MYFIQKSRHRVVMQISYLMLVFLLLSSLANAYHGRYAFVAVYIVGLFFTLAHLVWYHYHGDIDAAGERIMALLSLMFFSFFFIGEHKSFDILWVLVLPAVTVILETYRMTRRWLFVFIALLFLAILMQAWAPERIRYESFALWSLLWAGIFLSGMALYYKKTEAGLQQEIQAYQEGLQTQVADTSYAMDVLKVEKAAVDWDLTQSRLRSLETQLNPHFLFNALNSIAELLHHDTQKAEDAILHVSAFLRNTMSEKTLLPLSAELKNADDYLMLENLRFSDPIVLDLPDRVPPWEVPKFSIQLIVENAVKHGYVRHQKPLHIRVRFDWEHKTITVSNDGKPMERIVLGIGLENLKQRLKLLCNGDLEIVTGENPTFILHIGACCEHSYR